MVRHLGKNMIQVGVLALFIIVIQIALSLAALAGIVWVVVWALRALKVIH